MLRVDPTTATPSVPPTSRTVSFTADPAPAWLGGSVPMIASVAGLTDSASPAAISIIDTTIRPQYGVSERGRGGDARSRRSW